MDPADQWVFNPDTGSYELRASGGPRARAAAPPPQRYPPRPAPPSAQRHVGPGRTAPPRQRRPPGAGDRRPPSAGDVPPQRDRRAARGRRKVRKRGRGRRILKWSVIILVLVLLGTVVAGYLVYRHFDNNLGSVDVPFDNPAQAGEPVNILFIGSDQRIGEGNQGYGDAESLGHAETTILMHFSADRTSATALSIPRDLIVDIPDCETMQEDGSVLTIPGEQGVRFNRSYGQQGRDPGCTWKTVEQITGVKINHFMLADFNAVKDLSTAVGGVEVCLAKDIKDDKSHLDLPAGRHVIEGEEALAFVRTRKSVGFGSDLSRIGLQQQFLSSMARSLKSSDTFTNPGKLFRLAETVTSALTVDSEIGSLEKLRKLAQDLSQVPVKDISFVTLPVVDNPNEEVAATVVIDEAKALPLFEMIKQDKSLTAAGGDEPDGTGEDGKNGGAEPVPASELVVDVYNGGSVTGAAQETLTWLQNTHGAARTSNQGNAQNKQSKTTLEFGTDQAGQAATLAELMGLPEAALSQTSAEAGGAPMVLVLGDDFRGAGQPIEVPAERPADLESLSADDEDVCAS